MQIKKVDIVLIVLIFLFLFLLVTVKVIGRIDILGFQSDVLGVQDEQKTVTNKSNEQNKPNKPEIIYINRPTNNNNTVSNNTANNNTNNNNTSSNNTTGNNNTVTDNNTVTENSGFLVTDNSQVWKTDTVLHIFENPIYNMQEKIAPGSTNGYAFTLINTNTFGVNCNVAFAENNAYGINMKYRLTQNGNYICGDSNTWVTYAELTLTNIKLNSNQTMPYILEWKWFDSSNDTAIGAAGNVEYSLTIQIYATQI